MDGPVSRDEFYPPVRKEKGTTSSRRSNSLAVSLDSWRSRVWAEIRMIDAVPQCRSAAVLHCHWNSLRREVSCAWTKLVHGLTSTNVLMCYRVIISYFDIRHFNRISYDFSSPSPWQDDFGSYLHVVGKRGEPGRAGQFVVEECSLDSVDPFNMHPRCCEQPYLRLVSAIFLSNTS